MKCVRRRLSKFLFRRSASVSYIEHALGFRPMTMLFRRKPSEQEITANFNKAEYRRMPSRTNTGELGFTNGIEIHMPNGKQFLKLSFSDRASLLR